MSEQDYELIALVCGWQELERGWFHVRATTYPGWEMEFRCFETAREAVAYQRETCIMEGRSQ